VKGSGPLVELDRLAHLLEVRGVDAVEHHQPEAHAEGALHDEEGALNLSASRTIGSICETAYVTRHHHPILPIHPRTSLRSHCLPLGSKT
jgi:hypothetical protein